MFLSARMNPFLFKTPPIDLFNADQSYKALHRIYRRPERNMSYYMEKANGKRAASELDMGKGVSSDPRPHDQ